MLKTRICIYIIHFSLDFSSLFAPCSACSAMHFLNIIFNFKNRLIKKKNGHNFYRNKGRKLGFIILNNVSHILSGNSHHSDK